MTIKYTETTFTKPTIGKRDYEQLRADLSINPDTNFEPVSETIAQYFSGHMDMFKYCGIGFLIGVIGVGIFGDPSIFVAIYGISMVGFLFTGIHFLFVAPSYATFKNKRTAFYQELRDTILNTKSCEEFNLVFNNKK